MATTTLADVGVSLHVTDVTVGRFCDPDAPEALTLGDLICCFERGEKRFARKVVESMVDLFDSDPGPALPPEKIALHMTVAVGKLAQVVAESSGDQLTVVEREAFRSLLSEIESSVHQMRIAMEVKA